MGQDLAAGKLFRAIIGRMAEERQGQVPGPSTHEGVFILGLKDVPLRARNLSCMQRGIFFKPGSYCGSRPICPSISHFGDYLLMPSSNPEKGDHGQCELACPEFTTLSETGRKSILAMRDTTSSADHQETPQYGNRPLQGETVFEQTFSENALPEKFKRTPHM